MARAGRKDRGLLSVKDLDGKVTGWKVRLYHEGRERRFGSFTTKTQAREFYEKAKQEQKDGRFFPERFQRGGFAKLEEVLDGYLAAFAGRSLRDEKRYQKAWVALFPGARLNALTPTALEQARGKMAELGRSPQTINRYVGFLRRVLNKAVRDGQLAVNPITKIKMFKEPPGKTRFLSSEDEQKVFEQLEAAYHPFVRLAILTGMRQMEQFSLRWTDIDLEQGLITLPATKTGGVQYVHLNQEAKGILRRTDSWQRSVWVFPSANPATHLDPRNFYRRVWLPAVKAAGIEGATWHDLRHTFASRLAMSGATEGTIASLLRHSGTALVRRYAHLSPSHLKAEIEKVSAFGKSPDTQTEERPPMPQVSSPTVTETGTVRVGDGAGKS